MGDPVLQLLCRACPAACGLALGAAAIAPATTEAPSPLRINASAAPAEVAYGASLTLSGRVEGQAPAASMLELEANAYPYRAWHVLASAQPRPDGSFAFAGVRPQRNAMRVWQGKGDFLTLLKADKAVRAKLKPAEIEANFDLAHHFKHVDTIFKRVFGKS